MLRPNPQGENYQGPLNARTGLGVGNRAGDLELAARVAEVAVQLRDRLPDELPCGVTTQVAVIEAVAFDEAHVFARRIGVCRPARENLVHYFAAHHYRVDAVLAQREDVGRRTHGYDAHGIERT